ncbi:hypothetical protein [Nonomuraea guangzhouensis]|uniref:Uncharacterized protein n=1 Tax=Nonomuraea guangzhouensis TaxID=1291555 RepID=A0ABW4GZS5_9ACTN|nr:hypothetical protein [Nonomuraea guangzhouensis]
MKTATTIPTNSTDSPVRAFRVAVRDDSDTGLGFLHSTTLLTEAREALTRVRRAYPRSGLQGLFSDHDLGDWLDVTEDDLNRIADVTAAHTLAYILTINGLPRITWYLNSGDAGELTGSADNDVQVNAYAAVLGLEMQESETGRSTLVCAKGTFQGVAVRVSCYRRTPLSVDIDVSGEVEA